MKITVSHVRRRGSVLDVVLTQPLTRGGNLTPAGLRLLRVLSMQGKRSGASTNGEYQLSVGYRHAYAIPQAYQTRHALQATLDRFADVPMRLRFQEPIVHCLGQQHGQIYTMREVRAARKQGMTIYLSMTLGSDTLPLTRQDTDRLQRDHGIITHGPFSHGDGSAEAIERSGKITLACYLRPDSQVNPWHMAADMRVITRRVIV